MEYTVRSTAGEEGKQKVLMGQFDMPDASLTVTVACIVKQRHAACC